MLFALAAQTQVSSLRRPCPNIDPAKATKGRRMSKKTHEISKSAAVKPARARSLAAAPRLPAKAAKKVIGPRSATSVTGPANAKPAMTMVEEGQHAPAFQLPRDGGKMVAVSDYAGRKLVIFFYPRADTPGCTRETVDFNRLSGAFAKAHTAVIGISADPLKAQERFRDKYSLTIPLLSDESHATLTAYGVWGEKSMYGKIFEGVLRTTLLLDDKGRVARIWRRVKVEGHADEVLAAARDL
jgi:peroxiredoxin Q/BCP